MTHKLINKSTCLALLWILASSAGGQLLEWQKLESGLMDLPEFGSCITSLDGFEGYFYASVCLNQDPWSAVYRSADGSAWEEIWPGSVGTKAIRLGDGRILLYGSGGNILIGEADSWTQIPAGEGTIQSFATIMSAVEGNGRIVLAGSARPNRAYEIAWWVSTDNGETFAAFTTSEFENPLYHNPGIRGLAFGNGVFVAVGLKGEVWSGTDGENWTAHQLDAITVGGITKDEVLLSVQFREGAFYATGAHETLYRSTDGSNWDLLHSGPLDRILDSLLIEGDFWYAAGANGHHLWSDDAGQTWNEYYRYVLFDKLIGGNGVFYLTKYFSPTGGPISPERDISPGLWDSNSIQHVAYTEGKWLVLDPSESYLGMTPTSQTPFLDQATTSDGVNYQHPWFGWFAGRSADWAYHLNLGWIFSNSTSETRAWIHVPGLGWIYTTEAAWPRFYHFLSGHWSLYTGDLNFFWNENLEAWMYRDEFYQSPWVVNRRWMFPRGFLIEDSLGDHSILIVPNIANGLPVIQANFSIPYPDWPHATFTVFQEFDVTDTSREAGLIPGRQFTFDLVPIFKESPPDPNILTVVFTFDDDTGGVSRISYDFGPGFKEDNVEGTFTAHE